MRVTVLQLRPDNLTDVFIQLNTGRRPRRLNGQRPCWRCGEPIAPDRFCGSEDGRMWIQRFPRPRLAVCFPCFDALSDEETHG